MAKVAKRRKRPQVAPMSRYVPPRKPPAEKRTERVMILLSPREVEAIDEWRKMHEVWSRGEAIRALICAGLKARRK